MRYYKGEPSKYIIKYRASKTKKKCVGIGFWYRRKRNNIVSIPATTIDSNFIFSDGIEKDYVEFLSGTIVKIGVAEKKANLVV